MLHIHQLLTKHQVWMVWDGQGSSYTNPTRWHGGSASYNLNTYCWDCNAYTHHSQHDYPRCGKSKRTCNNCGLETEFQSTVPAIRHMLGVR
jgi:hypothetical protein